MEKLYLSWEDIIKDSRAFADNLRKQGHWTKLVAITRGGLVPAALLARHLDIKYIDTICLSSYDDAEDMQKGMNILKEIRNSGSEFLVIDDLVDTGETMKSVQEMLPHAHRACLYAKPKGVEYIHSYHFLYPQETWLVFPWEI